jgi:hypothetical protein
MTWTTPLTLSEKPKGRPRRRDAVRIGGVTYPSLHSARKALSLSTTRLYEMLKDGRAVKVQA